MYYYVKSNTSEQLKQLAKDGWYPGKKKMLQKQICIEAPVNMFPEGVNLIDVRIISEDSEHDRTFLFFGHRKFKAIKNGDPIPIVGKIVEK